MTRAERPSYLYSLTNRANGKQYIGISYRPKIRFDNHRTCAARGGKGCRVIHAAIRKYGWDSFEPRILAIGERLYIRDLERRAIAAFGALARDGTGYNIGSGGEDTTGWRDDPETVTKWRVNHSAAIRALFNCPEFIAAHAEANRRAAKTSKLNGTHKNTIKTHCPDGHLYASDNLYLRPRGGRECRECNRARQLRRNRRIWGWAEDTPVIDVSTKTHCKRGHLLSGQNLYLSKGGGRSCRVCRKFFTKRWQQKQKTGGSQ